MDRERKREIQVGVMVVVAVLVLIGGLMFFKRISLRSDMVSYAVDIPVVEGLRKGDRVQVRGIRVGQVTRFEIMPNTVRVFIEVEDWVELHNDAVVTLVMKGLVGEVLLEIEPGDGSRVAPDYVFTGRNTASMMALGDRVNESLGQMSALSEEVRLFISEMRAEGQLVGPLAAAERTFLETEGMLKENREEIRHLLLNLNTLVRALEGALGDGQLDSLLVTTRQAATSLDSTMVELRATTGHARTLLAGLERGEGTVGRLLNDPGLYDRADSTLDSLDRLLDQMRRNPKSMFKVSVF
ncbi:MAG TPA: MlaD family protein [Candidatus Krumholzibacteria bacterium]|nr:MlaD family protein [Candidatus Krumholzibacteria bacterium]HPD71982.1 MlaD family protein [Candidatus Krumholzibacteria bacterium]HRY41085.1 MlaD family protein [Candidatus Krumholzibacteria bacterium]